MLAVWITLGLLVLLLVGCLLVLRRRTSRGSSGDHAARHGAHAAAATRSVHDGPGLFGGGSPGAP